MSEHQYMRSAFLVNTEGNSQPDTGMTLRDYFAAKALQGLLADTDFRPVPLDNENGFDATARLCYQYADAMLKAREPHG